MTALAAALTRLETILDGSIAAMAAREALDDRAFADAKGRALLELTRIGQAPVALDEVLAENIVRVRRKLHEESTLLARRVAAAETIAELVAGAVELEEWDGTYPGPAGRGVGAAL